MNNFDRLKAHYVADLAHINAALRLREQDVERLRAQKATVERRLAEMEGDAEN